MALLFHIKKIFMSCYITFKKKTSTCGSQVDHIWVTSGLFCGSVGQMGQQVRPSGFQPWIGSYVCICINNM